MKFYRVCNPEQAQGLWYSFDGEFTGLIHDRFKFCLNNELRMDFDEDIVGYLSAVPDLGILWQWFTEDDVRELQKHGWFIHEYESEDYWFYERFQHHVIHKEKSIIIRKIEI